jgi:Tfp pilus assembly protein PilN
MITINLKPGAKRAKGASPMGASLDRLKGLGQKIKDPYRIGALILGTAWLGYVGMSHLTASAEISDLEPKLEQARAENLRFRAFLGEKRRLESVRDSIQAQIATIRHVDGDRYVWPHILDEVARSVPPFTWLTDVAVVNIAAPVQTDSTKPVEAPPVQVQVTGLTVDIQGYTRLLRQLEDSPYLTHVTAISANTVVEESRAVTKFVLRATFEHPSAGRQADRPSAASAEPAMVPASVAQARED